MEDDCIDSVNLTLVMEKFLQFAGNSEIIGSIITFVRFTSQNTLIILDLRGRCKIRQMKVKWRMIALTLVMGKFMPFAGNSEIIASIITFIITSLCPRLRTL